MDPDLVAPLRVLMLGPLRDQVGCESATLSFPRAGSQDAFWAALIHEFPAIAPSRVRLARGGEFLDVAEPLRPGDEIALIPPVSGG